MNREQDVRERKGSFFTPQIWVELSQRYIAETLGDNWQDEYYVWDCAAGTGNLLTGLTNKYNVWASTLDKADVEVMKDRIQNGANLLESHVFQFDFLNDSFSKLPKGLQDIINDPDERKRLVVYINPPYAEGGSSKQMRGSGEYKTGVERNKTHDKYHAKLAGANRELFAQFLIRVFYEIPACKIANFSKLKNLSGAHFKIFRDNFKAKLEKLFLCPANTFDNVNGQFPIGFFIWNTGIEEHFTSIEADVFNGRGDFLGVKRIVSYDYSSYFSNWVNSFKVKSELIIGWLEGITRNDFQHNNIIFIVNSKSQIAVPRGITICLENLIECCVCFAVRKVIPADWLNDRDQFLYPNDSWKADEEFQNDCLAYTLFNNNIRSQYGVNHWIPFTEREINACDKFDSHFMISFISGKVIKNRYSNLFEQEEDTVIKKRTFSETAKKVFDAGRELWRYYHTVIASSTGLQGNPVNASLYDIRDYFQGRNDRGKMNIKSDDETYNELMGNLRVALRTLAGKIEPKVFEFGFLSE